MRTRNRQIPLHKSYLNSLELSTFSLREQRRRFLKTALSSIAATTFTLSSGKKSWYSWAESQVQRPYLISVHLPGGWDTNWFHTAFPADYLFPNKTLPNSINPNLVKNLPSIHYDPNFPEPVEGETDYLWREVAINNDNNITQFYHRRYTERTKREYLWPHRNANGHFFGIGAQLAFGASQKTGVEGDIHLLENKVCIWKGIFSGGAHHIPNMNMIHGSTSLYAISYSGLVAEALANRYGKLKLNYVQLTPTPSAFGSNWAMAKGEQIPINIANHLSFSNLTKKDPQDLQNQTLYDQLNQSIDTLGNSIGKEKFTLQKSKEIYSEFMRFFKGTLEISQIGSNIAPFLDLWRDYAETARQKLLAMHSDPSFLSTISSEVVLPFQNLCYNYHLYAGYQAGLTPLNASAPLPITVPVLPSIYHTHLKSFKDQITEPFTASEGSLISDTITSGGFSPPTATVPKPLRAAISTAAWYFAMAEFLIKEGMSSVVDIAIPTFDCHENNPLEFRILLTVYSLYANLLKNLNDQNLLDRTLVVVFSEFDRSANISTDTILSPRGTSHDLTASILLAGYGVNQGKVVGDRLYGGQIGPTPISYWSEVESKTVTKEVDYSYLFPTIMKIFEIPIPSNQITDAEPVSAVLKGAPS